MHDMRTLIRLVEDIEQAPTRPDILYHATQPDRVAQILATNTIRPGTNDQASKHLGQGVSLSRSYDFAATWGRKSTVLILNLKGVETIPVDYWQNERLRHGNNYQPDEAEEFLQGALTNVRSRLIGIASRKCASYDVFRADVVRLWNGMDIADRKRRYGENYALMCAYMRKQFAVDASLWIDDYHP